ARGRLGADPGAAGLVEPLPVVLAADEHHAVLAAELLRDEPLQPVPPEGGRDEPLRLHVARRSDGDAEAAERLEHADQPHLGGRVVELDLVDEEDAEAGGEGLRVIRRPLRRAEEPAGVDERARHARVERVVDGCQQVRLARSDGADEVEAGAEAVVRAEVPEEARPPVAAADGLGEAAGAPERLVLARRLRPVRRERDAVEAGGWAEVAHAATSADGASLTVARTAALRRHTAPARA